MQYSFACALVACLASMVTSQLTGCPGTQLTYNGVDRTTYTVCSGSDYQVASASIFAATDYKACADKCLPSAGCTMAVFDTIDKVCHLKGSPTAYTWAPSDRYMTIKSSGTVAEGTVITACPWAEKLITGANGAQQLLCVNTDFQQPSLSWQQVPSQAACLDLCTKTAGCVQAVYDHIDTWCHLKAAGAFTWVVSTRYDTLRPITYKPDGTQLQACPTAEMSAQTVTGSKFLICNYADYVGPSNSWQQVSSQVACVELCAKTNGCAQAVYDLQNNWCHVKGAPGQLTWTTSTRYSTIRSTGQVQPANKAGKWSDLITLPLIPVQSFVIPEQPISNRLLLWSSYAVQDFGGDGGKTQFANFNYKTGAISQRQVANTNHDMFCPGMSALADGRLVIMGGASAAVTSIYDPKSDTFSRGADMTIPRGYQSATTLSNGKVFTVGGSFSGGIGGKKGEIYDPATNKWTQVPLAEVTPMLTTDAAGAWRTDNHGWLYGWKNGSVFQAGPSKVMHWYDTNGKRAVAEAGTRWGDHDQMCGVNVMYDAGKIFSAGGSQDYTDSDAFKSAFITTIGEPFQPATVERVADMNFARGFANPVVLPDGTIFIVGGQARSLVFTDTNSALQPEIFNPATKTFAVMAGMALARNYHSSAVLLADGTIFTGGGGMCYVPQGQSNANCNRAADHPNAQIFSPPYLFNADGSAAARPVISQVSSMSAKVGSPLTVTMGSNAGATFSLVRLGSSTHSTNTDQRRVAIPSARQNGNQFSFNLPADSGVLLPGYYYLFAVNAAGVPSVAYTIQVTL